MSLLRRIAWLSLGAVWTLGCTPGVARTVPLPEHLTFVVTHLDAPLYDHFDFVPGFDLDGEVGGGCANVRDQTSTITGEVGVDNQLFALSAFLDLGYDDREMRTFEQALDAQVSDGDEHFVIDLSEIDDGWRDDAVRVRMLIATEGADGFHTVRELGDVTGRIVDGRLSFEPDELPLPLGALVGTADLHGVRVAADVSTESLARGELGGVADVERVIDVAQLFEGGLSDDYARDIAMPDVEPDEDGDCQGVSAAMGFDAIPATLHD